MKQFIKQMLIRAIPPSIVVCTLAIGSGLTPVQAIPLAFFGEDLNFTNNPNTVADDPLRPTSIPNSTRAQTAFLANLIGVSTENFENFSVGISPGNLTFGTDTATLLGSPTIHNFPTGTLNGAYPTSGNQFLLHFGSAGSFQITFSSPQAAFGFFATDVGDGGAQLIVTLSGSTTTQLTVPHTVPTGSGSALYFGVIDTDNLFTRVTFTNTKSAFDGFGFDDMTIGRLEQVQVVPEPSTLALFHLGLLSLLGYSWRCRERGIQHRLRDQQL